MQDAQAYDSLHTELRGAVEAIIHAAATELPFAAVIAGIALAAPTFREAERHLTSLYHVALDAGHPFIPDLVDRALATCERVTAPDLEPSPARRHLLS